MDDHTVTFFSVYNTYVSHLFAVIRSCKLLKGSGVSYVVIIENLSKSITVIFTVPPRVIIVRVVFSYNVTLYT